MSQSRPDPTLPPSAAVAIAAAPNAPDRPRLVAKGKGQIAEQILALAYANGVKVREDADLVEMLEAVELDCEVPLPALAAIAEILTRVYAANRAAPSQNKETSQ